MRQSHLTYYFPRRADLLAAMLAHSHHTAEHGTEGLDFFEQLAALLFDRKRTRFLLAVIVETAEDSENRAATAAHLAHFADHLARCFARSGDDPAIAALVAQMRGMAMAHLVGTELGLPPPEALRRAAGLLGLVPAPGAAGLL